MVMVLGPTRKKADARAEQRRRRESASVAHDEPMDLDDLTHLADEIQEPEMIETTEVTDAPAPVPGVGPAL